VKPQEKNDDKTWEEIFIHDDISITKWIDSAADGIDMFLMGERLTSEKNTTHVRIQNATYINDGQPVQNSVPINLNLRLPNFEEYWLLKFTTYDENQEQRGIQNGYLRQTPVAQNYGAGIGLFHKLGNVRVAFQPRINLSNPLSISHSLSFESIANYVTYQINPRVELFADPTRGPGVFSSLNFNFVLSKTHSLTFINYSEYDGSTQIFNVTNGFSFGQIVNKRASLGYSLLFNSQSQPNYELSGYSFSIAISQLIYRKILDFQVIPHWDFIAANSYQGTVGLTVDVNLNF
jgi:hypothetical protein